VYVVNPKQSIAELAYQLWNARGRPHGSEEEDWLEAERQLTAAEEPDRESVVDASLKETFPASDPAASHIPDVPPSNAAEKWNAAGKKPRTGTESVLKRASASRSVGKATVSQQVGNPPVDETDDAPNTAPRDIGEG
jgi:Protein of unknown function (DUF2934)